LRNEDFAAALSEPFMIRDPMKVLMTALGIVLLLPVVGTLILTGVFGGFDGAMWLISTLIAGLGVFILYRTHRKPETNDTPDP
jgi:hypothetical protein